ncbi:uncharacterized protein BO96DRAFT_384372 [Aspergillus niger CBS 101883]|uniref:Uncharacterized protein n=3 Tax=Aspergillus niger TaxID=5061 RepID=A2QEX2_ASPNC|nr:uncharacterized protein BO96DRAFT_384372 [Aspergillus niger CBS 101883]XP_059603534.1 hypothetical protein An02g12520 [Aspergillus niger]PYH60380.1 hypothetical protein BO96DRAFT_384372 [Aspergillus niger CBS 101883]CAK44522.1 hypothetical protein An02g12520 [Aspergillus niger]
MAGNGIIQVLGTRPLRSRLAQLVVPRSGRTALALRSVAQGNQSFQRFTIGVFRSKSCPFHPSLVGRRKEEGHRSFLFCKGTTETMKSDVIAVRQVLTQKEYANDLHIEGLIVQCRLTYQQANSMIGMGYYYYSHQSRGSKGDDEKSRIVKRARVGKGSGKLTRATTRTRQKGHSHEPSSVGSRTCILPVAYSSIPHAHSELRGNRVKLLPTSVSGFTVGERARVEEGGERGGELGTALPVIEQQEEAIQYEIETNGKANGTRLDPGGGIHLANWAGQPREAGPSHNLTLPGTANFRSVATAAPGQD